ncbi:helix-turn-helix domain-containing protein [Methanocaldococcus fervens tailed virus 1]|uniref:Addiction module antidote protein n=2 Tax=root TaxID=1 RepID=C7P5H1_METFA|nr:helix-turn-helix domain-containing protein [Methanocaldococcus fervens]YP_010772304.1 helix-turn-helix domain-containing protein [Methanocaldococcus fervens tailed virus 1]ACV25349.1 putative addiction module antidote protein [Methanocaldococcus fervens AG86]QNO11479.1 helix-turn-helix domain-containing protein [Methanocaldococcus fervens tailed virus 1]
MTAKVETASIAVSIKAEGTLIPTTEQLLDELSKVVSEALNGTSYHALSKKTGVNVRTLYAIKNNELANPRIDTVLKILQALGKKLIIVDNW